jgi:hypothetical protein
MTQHLVLQVLVFLAVMIAVTVLPLVFIVACVTIMRAWMSPKGSRHVHHDEAAPTDQEVETPQ